MEGTCNDGLTALMDAAQNGQEECLKKLIDLGAQIDKQDLYGKTALFAAVEKQHTECVKLLQEAGANLNIADNNGNTVLISAVRSSNKPVVELLVDWGADVNVENNKGETALYLAVTRGHAEYERDKTKRHEVSSQIVYTLLLAGAYLHETKSGLNPCTVHTNTINFKKPNPEILKMLMAGGGSVYSADQKILPNLLQDHTRDLIRETLKQTNKKNLYYTVPHLGLSYKLQSYLLHNTLHNTKQVMDNVEKGLFLKIKERDVESVKYLMEEKANMNVQDENGITPLIIASQNGHLDLLEKFERRGADLNIQDLFGDTALIHAIRKQKKDCMQKLVELGAKINIQGKDGDTALIHAAKLADEKFLYSLIEGGADPNTKNDNGSTALIFGAKSLKCLIKLIEAGANVNCKDQDGHTALIRAAESGEVDCLMKLIESGAELNNDKKCKTALMAAAVKGHVQCVKLLIQEGADLNIQDEHSYTALMLAGIFGYDTCFNTLFKAGAEMDLCDPFPLMPKEYIQGLSHLMGTEDTVLEEYPARLGRRMVGMLRASHDTKREEDETSKQAELKQMLKQWLKAEAKSGTLTEMIKCETEQRRNLYRLFFQAGGTPDYARNIKDFKSLTNWSKYFGWKSPLKLSTLCMQISSDEMLDVVPIPSGCPMTATRKGRRYLATVAKGEAISLQGDRSEVKLVIKEGCPKRAYLMEVRTDPKSFDSIIPDNECFITPIVEVLAPAETSTSSYVLRIPHCLDEDDDHSKVKVRMIHENRNPAVVQVPTGNAGPLYYNINARFIELHTTHFTSVVCTICQTSYHCRERIHNLWFARYDTPEQTQKLSHNVRTPRFKAEFSPEEIKKKIEEMAEAAGFDKLPRYMTDSENASLAQLFSLSTLETMAVQRFDISQAEIDTWKDAQRDDIEGLKRTIFHNFRNKGNSRKDLYGALLEAEFGGLLTDVDVAQAEKVIIGSGAENRVVAPPSGENTQQANKPICEDDLELD